MFVFFKILYLLVFALSLAENLQAANYTVNNNLDDGSVGSLRYVLIDATIQSIISQDYNHNIGFSSSISGPITLVSPLPALINSLNVTIDGSLGSTNATINGNSNYNAFWVYNGTLKISNLNIQNCTSKGGTGGEGAAPGGGGMGAGGALFINSLASVDLNNVNIDGSKAIAGEPGNITILPDTSNNSNGNTSTRNYSSGGGGGINGNGGNGRAGNGGGDFYFGGCGGGGGVNSNGGDGNNGNGGGGGVNGNGGTGGDMSFPVNVSNGGGGGFCADGGSASNGGNGGGGGIGIGANGGNSDLDSSSNLGDFAVGAGGGGINAQGGSVIGAATGGGGGGGCRLSNSSDNSAFGADNNSSGSALGGADLTLNNNKGGNGGANGNGGLPSNTGIGGGGGNGYNYIGVSINTTNYGGGGGGNTDNLSKLDPFGGQSFSIGGGGGGLYGGSASIGGGGGSINGSFFPKAGISEKIGGGGGGQNIDVQNGIGGSGGLYSIGQPWYSSGFGGGKGGMIFSNGSQNQNPGFGGGNGGSVNFDSTGTNFIQEGAQAGQAYGGAIFVRSGGSLNMNNVNITNSSIAQSISTAPNAANPGGTGDAIYFHAEKDSSNNYIFNDLRLNNNTDQFLNDSMEGYVNLIKGGLGTLSLIGNHGYTGDTAINSGTLVVNGYLASPNIVVKSGSTIKGIGSLQNVISNGGTIYPGNSIGTINFASLMTDADTNFAIEINPDGTSSLINITGNANINGGTIKLYPDSGIYVAGTTYTIMQTGGLINMNSTSLTIEDQNTIALRMRLNYLSNKITLDLINYSDNFGSNLVPIISGICTSPYCLATENYIENLSQDSISNLADVFANINNLPDDASKVTSLEDLLAGKRKAFVTSGFYTQDLVLNSLKREFSKSQLNKVNHFTRNDIIKNSELTRLQSISSINIKKNISGSSQLLRNNYKKRLYLVDNSEKPKNLNNEDEFSSGEIIFNMIYAKDAEKESKFQSANNSNLFAFLIGRSFEISEKHKLTLSSSYAQNNINYQNSKGSSQIKHLIFGINHSYENPIYQVNSGVSFGPTVNQDQRQINIGNMTRKATSSHFAADVGAYTELSRNLYFNNLLVKPKIGLELLSQIHQGYKEKNSDESTLNLNFKKQFYSMAKASIGVEFTKIIRLRETIFMPSLGFGYGYSKDINKTGITSGLVINDSYAQTIDNSRDKSEIDFNFNLVAAMSEKVNLVLKYDATFKKHSKQHEIGLNFEVNF